MIVIRGIASKTIPRNVKIVEAGRLLRKTYAQVRRTIDTSANE